MVRQISSESRKTENQRGRELFHSQSNARPPRHQCMWWYECGERSNPCDCPGNVPTPALSMQHLLQGHISPPSRQAFADNSRHQSMRAWSSRTTSLIMLCREKGKILQVREALGQENWTHTRIGHDSDLSVNFFLATWNDSSNTFTNVNHLTTISKRIQCRKSHHICSTRYAVHFHQHANKSWFHLQYSGKTRKHQ